MKVLHPGNIMKLEQALTEILSKISAFMSFLEILNETHNHKEHNITGVDAQTGKGGTRFSYKWSLASVSTTLVNSDQRSTLSVNKSKRGNPNLSQGPSHPLTTPL